MKSSYRDLQVWHKAIALAKRIYELSKQFDADERFALTQQIRRAAVSIPSNLAEGCMRQSSKEFLQFIAVARGSLAEVDTQLILAREFAYISSDAYEKIYLDITEIGRMLAGLRNSLTTKNQKP